MSDKPDFLSREKFMRTLWSYKRGSISRRQFLATTGLGVATAVLGAAMPGLRPRRALAQGSIGDRVVLATWPNYHDPANFDAFAEATGAQVQVNVFGSNEEMLASFHCEDFAEGIAAIVRPHAALPVATAAVSRAAASGLGAKTTVVGEALWPTILLAAACYLASLLLPAVPCGHASAWPYSARFFCFLWAPGRQK